MKRTIILIFLISFSLICFSKNIDSLKLVCNRLPDDTNKINALITIAGEYFRIRNSDDSIITYGKKALALSERLNFKLGIAKSYRRIGVGYNRQSDYKKALNYFNLALKTDKELGLGERIRADYINMASPYINQGLFAAGIENLNAALAVASEMKNDQGIFDCLSQIAQLYSQGGEYSQALDNYLKALSLIESLKDTALIVSTQVQVGNTYSDLHDVKNAMVYFNKALFLCMKNKNNEGLRLIYNCMGIMYQGNKEPEKALPYHEKCLALAITLGDYSWVRASYAHLGNISKLQGNYKKALEYHFNALKIAKELNNSKDWAYMCLAQDYFAQGSYKLSKLYGDSVSDLQNGAAYIIEAELLISKADSALGNTAGAYLHYKNYIALRDRSDNNELLKAATKERYEKEYAQQKAEDKAAQEKKDLLAKEEAYRNKIVRNSFMAGFALVLILALVILRSYRQKQRSNEELAHKNIEIEEKNKSILDSIRYAQRIQQALLPTEKYMQRVLREDQNKTKT